MSSSDPQAIMVGQPTIAARIRALAAAGFSRTEIAKLVQRSYQQVRQVLLDEERRRSLGGTANARLPEVREETAPFEHLRGVCGPPTETLALDDGGRLTLPASMLEVLGLAPGDAVLAIADGDKVIKLMSPETALEQAQAIVRASLPEGVSAVDDFLAWRRREAERDWDESEKACDGG